MPDLRGILSFAVPTVTLLFGFLWYFGRKKPPKQDAIKDAKKEGREKTQATESNEKTQVVQEETIKSCTSGSVSHTKETERIEEKISQDRVQILTASSVASRKRKADRISRDEKIDDDEKGFDTVDEEIERDDITTSATQNEVKEVQESITCEDVTRLGSQPNDRELSSEADLTDILMNLEIKPTENSVENKSLHMNDAFTSSGIMEHLKDTLGSSEASEQSFVTEKEKESKDDDISLSTSTMEPLFESTMIDALNCQPKENESLSDKTAIVDLAGRFENSVSVADNSSSHPSEDVKDKNCVSSNCSSDFTSADIKPSKGSERPVNDVKNSGKTEKVKTNRNKAKSDTENQSSIKDKSLESLNNCKEESQVSPVKKENHSKGLNNVQESVVPGSDSNSSNCDNASESSNDSGKGRSVTDLPNSPNVSPSPSQQVYQFNFPTAICGRLIGKHGRNINMIKERSGANISLNANPFTPEFQICVVEGTRRQIDNAIRDISRKFPEVDLSPVNIPTKENSPPQAPILMPEIMQVIPDMIQLNLPEGVSVDAVVSSIVDAGHMFIQQPTHPSFPSLERLSQFMMACYTQDGIVPQMPRPLEVGVICAAPMMGGWYRTQIAAVYEDVDECDVKYVDYGGFSRVKGSDLRQIRSDFMTLPFQACECYMANITPLQDEEYFSPEAAAVLEDLTQGQLLQAQVVGRSEGGIPYVHIYQISGDKVTFVNREMVNRSVVRWVEILS